MKKFLGLLLVAIFIFIGSNNSYAQKSGNMVLQGGVETNVPRTPDEVTAYLIKMKAIMAEYDQLAMQLSFMMTRGNTDIQSGNAAKNEWIRLSNKIYSITPPQELSLTHKQLADSLKQTSSFLDNLYSRGGASQSPQAMMAIVGQISALSKSAIAYQSGVSQIINKMGLDPSLNPLGSASVNSLNTGNIFQQFQF